MKKTEYMSPEMEVIKLKYQKPLLEASSGDTEIITPPEEPGGNPPRF